MWQNANDTIDKMLEEPEFETLDIDERAEKFWELNRMADHYPVKMEVDKVYERYIPAVIGQGLKNEDYDIQDRFNPKFHASLTEFLDMSEKGVLPIKRRRTFISRSRDWTITVFLLILAAIALLASYYVITYLIFGQPSYFSGIRP